MNDDLYFIPIIAETLRKKDAKESLGLAFDLIRSLGAEPQYAVGFKQFERFMAIVKAKRSTGHTGLVEANMISTLITELVTDTFEDSEDEKQKAVSLIRSRPQWRREYDELIAETEWLSRRPAGVGITIFHENIALQSVTFTDIPSAKTIEDLTPGGYHITFATGRLIWEGRFTERDLLWTKAFPGRRLKLAADSERRKSKSTRQISALDGEITIGVFAGIESGQIVITLNAFRDVK